MSARHANGRDSICCDSVGGSPICARLGFNDLTSRAELAPREPGSGCGGHFVGGHFVGGLDFFVGADIPGTIREVDRAFDCVDVSASDRRFNQPRLECAASFSEALPFMTSTLETSCTTTPHLPASTSPHSLERACFERPDLQRAC
jgi:hypothetical protein